MNVAVIGPSNVGKSSSCGAVVQTLACRSYDLDELVSQYTGSDACDFLVTHGSAVFFRRCVAAYKKQVAVGDSLVAVGAGTLEHARDHPRQVRNWLKTFDHVVTIYDAPANVHSRRTAIDVRSLAEFTDVEYAPYRVALYDFASQRLDVTGLTVAESCVRFADMARVRLSRSTVATSAARTTRRRTLY